MTAAPRGWRPGPGFLVAAAFIGPGTVTTASRAGAAYGFGLLGVVLLSVLAAVTLQEMAARLGVVARMGLAEAIGATLQNPWARRASLGLVLLAIVLGNTAYQTGNLVGAGMGAELMLGVSPELFAAALGCAVAVILAAGVDATRITGPLALVVVVMSAAFIATAAWALGAAPSPVDASATAAQTDGTWLIAIALLGTTVVPYNLFLHASAAKRRWRDSESSEPSGLTDSIASARWDAAVAIGLGGIVTASIVVTAATALRAAGLASLTAVDLAQQLTPLLGRAGEGLFAFGLMAAGVTSAVTAPLAAGYAASGVLAGGDRVVRGVAAAVSLTGALLAVAFGKSPQATIIAAQVANGLLLPLVACFLLWVMNRRALLGEHRNGPLANAAGVLVVAVAAMLGAVSLWRLL